MKLVLAFMLFSLFLSSDAAIKNMIEAVYIPGDIIKIEGRNQNNETIIFEYDRKNDILTRTIGADSVPEKLKDFELFLKLFFFKAAKNDPESFSKTSGHLIELLKKNSIDTTKLSPAVSSRNGQAALSIGKDKRFYDSNELVLYKNSFLPAALLVNQNKYLFSDYHKSIFPAAFPGKIEIYSGKEIVSTWIFYRKEYL